MPPSEYIISTFLQPWYSEFYSYTDSQAIFLMEEEETLVCLPLTELGAPVKAGQDNAHILTYLSTDLFSLLSTMDTVLKSKEKL